MSILTIVVIILILGLICCIVEWIRDHFIPIIIVIASVLGLIFYRNVTLWILAISGAVALLYLVMNKWIIPLLHNIRKKISIKKQNRIVQKAERQKQLESELRKKEIEQAEKDFVNSLPDAVQVFLNESNNYLAELDNSKSTINSKEMLSKVAVCQDAINDINNEVRLSKEVGSSLRKLTSYYYPTICKLVKKYSVYEARKEDRSNVKVEILNAMDKMNDALVEIKNNVISADDIDVLSDISVLDQMLDRDGLKK